MIVASWNDIFGQTEAVSKLKHFVSSGNLNHAYLFIGPQGVGKHTTAKVFASAINCEAKGCGKCSCCVKIINETHPDVFQVVPEGNFITIEQVREIQKEANLKPFEAGFKVYLIDEVEKMTLAAANALLKILEEPPVDVIFILITSNLDGVLPTIISRCCQIYFRSIATEVIIDEIMCRYKIDKDRVELVARVSGGIFGNVVELLNSNRKLKRRESVLYLAEKLKRLDALELVDEGSRLISEVEDFLGELKLKQEAELAEVEEIALSKAHGARLKKRLVEKQKRDRGREEFKAFEDILDFFSSWYRDILIITGCFKNNFLTNIDCEERLRNLSKELSFQGAQRALEIIQETKRILRFNVNKQLALEVMLFKLQEVA
ncbi:DNA polymerase III subunit delta' [Candidatus Oleimmundimicrobium sp.]|uniref:DNA polymerase III subunit delta' n=1 Tax=Candidatus Oleimmundimicrobium sp. TaxID=3060597 RepID=UPI002723BAC3|nr:DNA polymerase III subunit delta' [Candidatus Oleimmundimicrobium sp.]MDO8886422.1 DNA polymerase III subunit delta' [Candidatus Oleimmundimicrobium sp.]